MKLLILAIDGMDPKLTAKWLDDLPTIKSISSEGCFVELESPYFSSFANWASHYTGEHPDIHQITYGAMRDGFAHSISNMKASPVWSKLASDGVLFGLCSPFMISKSACEQMSEVNGWMTGFVGDAAYNSGAAHLPLNYDLFSSSEEVEKLALWEQQKPWPTPVSLPHYGREWSEAWKPGRPAPEYTDIEDLRAIVPEDYYSEGAEALYNSLMFKLGACDRICEKFPVDVLFVYELRLDIVSHFTMLHPPFNTLRTAYMNIDRALDAYLDMFEPEHVAVISDHGFAHYKNKADRGMNEGIVTGCHTLPALGVSSIKSMKKTMPIHYFTRMLIAESLDVELNWEAE